MMMIMCNFNTAGQTTILTVMRHDNNGQPAGSRCQK
jgi:hypothetical protein